MKKAIIIFTRVPVPGQTKTRLMPFLSGEECAALHTAFLKDIYASCRAAGEDIFIYYTPREKLPILQGILGKDGAYVPQEGETLGERMEQAFADVFLQGYEKAVLVGTDIPQMETAVFDEAFEALDSCDVAINPTKDGGYYLIGMKQNHPGIWRIREYGTNTVVEETMNHIRELKLTVACGRTYMDIDTKEDLITLYEEIVAGCIHCGRCRNTCAFLEKYEMDLKQFSERKELAYHCFLCGECKEACPKEIDGRELALLMRKDAAAENGGKPEGKGYQGLLAEKNPYLFSAYKGAKEVSLFMGCNFPSFLPKTEKRLLEIVRQHGIGVIYDCCGKPVEELGLCADAQKNLAKLRKRLKDCGVKELVMVCPNCYHYLKGKLDVKIVSVYEKLWELGIGASIEAEKVPVFYPCPDRSKKELMQGIRRYLKGEEVRALPGTQCCGLGGCAGIKEKELARSMAGSAEGKERFYTYCASCISSFQRNGCENVVHILSAILEVEETIPSGIRPFLNRAVKKIRQEG